MPLLFGLGLGIDSHLGINNRRSHNGIRMRNRLGLLYHPGVTCTFRW